MALSYQIGDRLICVYQTSRLSFGKIGRVVEIYEDTYRVQADDGTDIGGQGEFWGEESSFRKMPNNTKPLTPEQIIVGTKVVYISPSYKPFMAQVGVVYSVTESTFRVHKPDGFDLGVVYWNKRNHDLFHEVLEDPSQTMPSSGIAIQEVVIQPAISTLCPLKYYGTDSCTCGTCPTKKPNPFFLKV